MSELVLGLATMNGGKGTPGSTLKLLIDKLGDIVDRIVIIDGDLKPDSYTDFSYQNKTQIVDQPWKQSLKLQFETILEKIGVDNWWLMLDDDEIPGDKLIAFCHSFVREIKERQIDCNTIATPRLTYFTTNGSDFYPGELEGQAWVTPRRIFYKVSPNIHMLCSPAGRDVVPIRKDEKAIYLQNLPHIHLKAPEQYVVANIIKTIYDPHEIQDPGIRARYLKVMSDNNIYNYDSLVERTISKNDVNQNFKDFCIDFDSDTDRPHSRLFMWYYNIIRPYENPKPEKDWTYSLKKLLNINWRTTYVQNKNPDNCIHVPKDMLTPYWAGTGAIEL